MIALRIWILILTVKISKEECWFEKNLRHYELLVRCSNTNPDNFLYDFFENDHICEFYGSYSLSIANSKFVNVHSFGLPCSSPRNTLSAFSLTRSSVEFVEDGAFEDFSHIEELNLGNNNLRNLSFVSTLPTTLRRLILNNNNFEIVNHVFNDLGSLEFLDLSNCKIRSVDSNSFSTFSNELGRLSINLSFNDIEYLNWNTRISFSVDLSYNHLLSYFNGENLINLNLSNTNIDSSFDFKIVRLVGVTVDLSNNNIGAITPKTFGTSFMMFDLILSNSSITDIQEKSFYDFTVEVLNISSNFMTELRNYTFVRSAIEILDLSNCLIHTIDADAFSDLLLKRNLNLANNRLTRIFKTTFHHLTSVQNIDLSFNSIEELDDQLFIKNENLRFLNLSNNKIQTIQNKTFVGIALIELHLQNNLINRINFQASFISGILNLQNNTFLNLDFSFLSKAAADVILLSNNNIQKLSNNSIPITRSIEEINLSNSKICSIDMNTFWRVREIEILNLSYNCLEKILPQTFFPLKKLTQLDLSGNEIKLFSRDAFMFGNHLKRLSISFFGTDLINNTFIIFNNLETLDIVKSRIMVLQKDSFKGLIRLVNLNLHDIEIEKINPGAFNGLNSLITADFQILFKNISVIKSGTFKGLRKLEKLNLSDLHISLLESEAFTGLCSLQSLLLNNNKLETIVKNTFKGLNSLKYLNLSSNFLFELDPQAFFGLVNLTEISLSGNNLTKIHLGTFQEFPNLRKLDLHKNNINKILTGTFSNLKSLTELDLSYNNITKLKMENLIPLTNLIILKLTGNHLIQMSHLDLIKSLTQLKFVTINDNKWKCDNLATMLMAFQKNKIDWVFTEAMNMTDENIDGIKCYDICKFFYCVEEEENLYRSKHYN